MSTADQIANRAMELASGLIEQSKGELLEMAGGDHDLLFRASQLVRERSGSGPASEHSIEHLAFSLIASAHEDLRHQ